MANIFDLSTFRSELPATDKIQRLIWGFVWATLFRPSPRTAFGFRRFLLRCFGATIGEGVKVYNSTLIFNPSRLTIGDYSIIGPGAEIYNVATIGISNNCVISQGAYLCSATHDYLSPNFALIAKPIEISPDVWICARSFIGPGVKVARGAVIGAMAVVFSDIGEGDIVAGNPAKTIRNRFAFPPDQKTQ